MKITAVNFYSPKRSNKAESNTQISINFPINLTDSVNLRNCHASKIQFKCLSPKLTNLPCAYCGKKMISIQQAMKLASDLNSDIRSCLSDLQKIYADSMNPIQIKCIEELIKAIEDTPHANLTSLLKSLQAKFKPEIRKIQLDILQEQIAYNLPENIKRAIRKRMDITRRRYLDRRAINDYIADLQRLKDRKDSKLNKEVMEEILELAEELNSEKIKVYLFFLQPKNARVFAEGLFKPSMATADHIKPKSRGGKDNEYNILAACSECNGAKGDTPLSHFIAKNLEILNHLIQYFKLLFKSKDYDVKGAFATVQEEAGMRIFV